MAWIQPNTTVKILRNVPLDMHSENTLWFPDATSQAYQFATYTKYTFENPPAALYYQRHHRNSIRINRVADDLYDCNYLMFKNTAYSNKWFYAFITGVNYINDGVTEVKYKLDDVQCWMFDYTFEDCFIERMHQEGDSIGANIVPEDLELNDYIFKSTLEPPNELNAANCKVVVSTSLLDGQGGILVSAGGGVYRGVYSGCDYLTFDTDAMGISDLEQYISSLYFPDRTDAILNIFLCPSFLITQKDAVSWQKPHISYPKPTNAYGGDGVLGQAGVRNNKLLTYPYTFLYVTDYRGMGKAYPYEYFGIYWNDRTDTWNEGNAWFELNGDFSAKPTVTLVPINYKNEGAINTENTLNKDEIVTSGDYPQLTYNVDAFKAALAQSIGLAGLALGAATGLGVIGAAVGAGVTASLEGANAISTIGEQSTYTKGESFSQSIQAGRDAALDTVGGVAKRAKGGIIKAALHQGKQVFLNPVEQRGNQNSTALFVNNCMGFGFGMKQVRPETLSRLDDYFTMYGYAQKYVGKPKTHVREEWTYIKTIGCAIHGNLPADAAENICERFDAGIRFWTDRTKVGNYNRNNPTYHDPI